MIKIACLLNKKNGRVAGLFREANHAVFIDAETSRFLTELPRGGMTDEEFALRLAKEDPEAVITGPIERRPFEILAERYGITRYDGRGCRTGEAVRLMNAYRLPIIPDFIGGSGCHSGEACHEH